MLAELKQAQKNYQGFSLDCSLEIPEDRVTGLIGANGAGKTTAFKALLGLIRLDSGESRIFGRDAASLAPEEKEKLGVILAGGSFNPSLTIKQITGIMEKLYHKFDAGTFQEQCRHFSLPMDKRLKEFSSGMKAKFKILLAMSHAPRLLILDEPTVGLDVVAREEIMDVLREYMETPGRGILISSHISSDLEGLCDDVYLIEQGKIVMHEETDVLMDNYGILKVDEKQYRALDKRYILRVRREPFGYSCLTSEKNYYYENYPGYVLEKGTIDSVISMMAKGESV